MHNFEVHSSESECRKVDALGWTKSNTGNEKEKKHKAPYIPK